MRTDAGSARASSTFRTGLHDEDDWAGSAWIGNARTPDDGDALTLDGASWIWTPESTSPPPAEDRAFRSTRTTPAGTTATGAEILITADDSFRLWVNGRLLGSSSGAENEWQQSRRFETAVEPDRNVFAVQTTNGPGSPAGLIARVRMRYADGTTSEFATGADWKASKIFPADFWQPAFDDSGWGTAAQLATYGDGPWGRNVRPPRDEARPAPLLRREFAVTGPVRNATLYLAAGGYADVSLNGAPASDDVLSPGFTDYDDTVQYVATDLTAKLKPGVNALGMELGRGFYGMTGGNVWRWESPPWHDEPVVRARLRIEYADGRVADVVTDDRWRIADGPTVVRRPLRGRDLRRPPDPARVRHRGLRRRRLGARERGRRTARDAGQPAPAADPGHRVAAGRRDHRAGRRHLRGQVPPRARRLGADRRDRAGRDHDPRAVRREAQAGRAPGLLQQRRLPGRVPDRPLHPRRHRTDGDAGSRASPTRASSTSR